MTHTCTCVCSLTKALSACARETATARQKPAGLETKRHNYARLLLSWGAWLRLFCSDLAGCILDLGDLQVIIDCNLLRVHKGIRTLKPWRLTGNLHIRELFIICVLRAEDRGDEAGILVGLLRPLIGILKPELAHVMLQ